MYVAIHYFWDDMSILCCGTDELLVEKKGYEIAKQTKLRGSNIEVVEVELID